MHPDEPKMTGVIDSRGIPRELVFVLLLIFVGTVVLIMMAAYFGLLGAFIAEGSKGGAESTAWTAPNLLLFVAPWAISLLAAAFAWLVTRSDRPSAGKRQTVGVWIGIVVIALTPIELLGLISVTVHSGPTIAALLDVLRPGWNDADEDWKRQQHVYQFENALYGDPPLEGQPDTTYVSIPDADPNCSHAGLPPLPAPGRYHCVPPERLIEHDGTGWLPWRTAQVEGAQSAPARSGPPKVDPRNQATRGLYYRFRMPSERMWLLTVPLARDDDFPSGNPPPLDRSMILQRNGTLLVLSGTRHTRLSNGRNR